MKDVRRIAQIDPDPLVKERAQDIVDMIDRTPELLARALVTAKNAVALTAARLRALDILATEILKTL